MAKIVGAIVEEAEKLLPSFPGRTLEALGGLGVLVGSKKLGFLVDKLFVSQRSLFA